MTNDVALLQLLGDGQEHHNATSSARLADHFQLTEEERTSCCREL